ncbi:MAG: DUF1015 domain-containing protein [Leptospiraceae bacterium]|nr:DUF1015 domain-containing protein [Leptospiraceae bacterium]
MVNIAAFRALRPAENVAARLVSVPYDVIERDEARQMAADNPVSYLRIIRSDLEFADSQDPYAPAVYEKAAANLRAFEDQGWLVREPEPCLYIYRLNWRDQVQTGLVAGSSVRDYENDVIKKHEFTRPEKERDRTVHIDTLGANTGPVFLLYRSSENPDIARSMNSFADQNDPLYDLSFEDGVRHRVYRVPAGELQNQLLRSFSALRATYIADGHHRAASAVSNGKKRRAQISDDQAAFNYFLSVIFPDEELSILPYNRVVRDLNGRTPAGLLENIKSRFTLQPGKLDDPGNFDCNMFLDGQWYHLHAPENLYDSSDEIGSLAVSIIQKHILQPELAIDDPRTSDRIAFVGGIKGDAELERLVNSGKFAVAFSMPPVQPEQLVRVADAGKVMPPKSTWFEPKLRSGFFVHLLDR